MSFGRIVTRLAWVAHRLVSSKTASQIGLTCFLQSTKSCTLQAQICFEVLSNFSHQMLEGKFANQKIGGLPITSNFTGCHGTRPVTMRLLHPSIEGVLLRAALVTSCFTTCGFAARLVCMSRGIETPLLTLLRLQLGQLEAVLVLEADQGAAPAVNTILTHTF
ncbi:hypothetical protein mRhiFer1_008768 [Rhinolophus ferrumequinum]|uniref:Uncharacterized protein n=1 Tax=Rhinolophus ferrumequinum TaxID=59479 RepID=A0A7J7TN86_RHIFE|nr:hypothetical protein mRhiFer1_008768 [Rhinolophus ferrumequinum]